MNITGPVETNKTAGKPPAGYERQVTVDELGRMAVNEGKPEDLLAEMLAEQRKTNELLELLVEKL